MKYISISLALLASVQSFAQKGTPQTDTLNAHLPLSTVVVTANKTEQQQMSTGKEVTVITKAELQRHEGQTLTQVLNQQAGIVINGAYGAPGSVQTLYTRGAPSGRTLILLDGVPVYDPSMIGNEFDLSLIAIQEVERIEICKGAQSTLYGSDAIAGVINIITGDSATRAVQSRATLAGGNLGTFKGNAEVYGKAGRLQYSVRYAKLYTNGFSSAFDSTGKKNFDRDGYNGDMTMARLQYQVNDHLAVQSFLQYSAYRADIDAGIFADDGDYVIHNKNLVAGGGFRYRNGIVSLTGNYQYNDLTRKYLDDSTSIGGFAKFSSNDYYGKTQFAELYASIRLSKDITLLQGADYRIASMNNQYLSISSFGPYTSSFKDTSQSQGSMYATLQVASGNERLHADLGGRLNVHSRYGSNFTYSFNPSFLLWPGFRVLGSVASGFKAPSLYQLYDASSGNRSLLPEKSVNLEIGLEHSSKMFSDRVFFFYRDIRDGIDYNYVSFKYFNFSAQIARGVEYEFSLNAGKQLVFSGNWTVLSVSETTSDRVALNKNTTYPYALRRPRHNVNLFAEWKPLGKLSLQASFKYVSDRYDAGGYKVADVKLGSYALLGAHADYTLNGHLRFFADLQNITDKKFFDVNGYNSIPFTAIAGIGVKL